MKNLIKGGQGRTDTEIVDGVVTLLILGVLAGAALAAAIFIGL